ncbi:hypothetical protein C8R43DRAFT_610185 [Mycena crocata]|nr:hypothetical protein C8R43DRAFT_610185 [Mycena crocata]
MHSIPRDESVPRRSSFDEWTEEFNQKTEDGGKAQDYGERIQSLNLNRVRLTMKLRCRSEESSIVRSRDAANGAPKKVRKLNRAYATKGFHWNMMELRAQLANCKFGLNPLTIQFITALLLAPLLQPKQIDEEDPTGVEWRICTTPKDSLGTHGEAQCTFPQEDQKNPARVESRKCDGRIVEGFHWNMEFRLQPNSQPLPTNCNQVRVLASCTDPKLLPLTQVEPDLSVNLKHINRQEFNRVYGHRNYTAYWYRISGDVCQSMPMCL